MRSYLRLGFRLALRAKSFPSIPIIIFNIFSSAEEEKLKIILKNMNTSIYLIDWFSWTQWNMIFDSFYQVWSR